MIPIDHQARYVAAQTRKAATLVEVQDDVIRDAIRERRSVRRFNNQPVDEVIITRLLEAAEAAPSSCDRRGAAITRIITDRDDKALLSGLLVGGVGWVHRAGAIMLVTANPAAYGAPGELEYLHMPQLDAGFLAQNVLITAQIEGLASCFVNPNIRPRDREFFTETFLDSSDAIYCGAIAVGYAVQQ